MGMKKHMPFILLAAGIFAASCSRSAAPRTDTTAAKARRIWHSGRYAHSCKVLSAITSLPDNTDSRFRVLRLVGRCRALGLPHPKLHLTHDQETYLRAMTIVPGQSVGHSIDLMESLARRHPEEPEYRWRLALFHMMAHRYGRAARIIKTIPPTSRRLLALARCQVELGLAKDALDTLERLPPLGTKAQVRQAAVLHRLARTMEPLPPDLSAGMERVKRLMRLKAYPGARQILRQLSEKYPWYPDTWYMLAITDLIEGHTAHAVVHLNKALMARPDDADSLVLMARIELGTRNLTDAISHLKAAVKAAPFDMEPYRMLIDAQAQAHNRMGELETLAMMERRFGHVLASREKLRYAALLDESGRSEDAMAVYRQVATSTPKDSPEHDEALLGQAKILVNRAQRGDRKARRRARNLLKRLSKRHPLDSRPKFLLQKLEGKQPSIVPGRIPDKPDTKKR